MALTPHALSTVALTKVGLGISTSDLDTWLEGAINGISQQFEKHCGGRHFEFNTYTEYHTGTGQFLYLKQRPLVSITSVTEGVAADRTGGTSLTLNTDYVIDSTEQSGLFRYAGWQDGRLVSTGPMERRSAVARNIKVVYKAGYIMPQYGGSTEATYNPSALARDLPYDLEQALWYQIDFILGKRLGRAYKSQSLPAGGLSFSYAEYDICPDAKSILYEYKEAVL